MDICQATLSAPPAFSALRPGRKAIYTNLLGSPCVRVGQLSAAATPRGAGAPLQMNNHIVNSAPCDYTPLNKNRASGFHWENRRIITPARLIKTFLSLILFPELGINNIASCLLLRRTQGGSRPLPLRCLCGGQDEGWKTVGND